MKVSSSILKSNNKKESIIKLNNTSTDYIHFDVADGKFVSNTAFPIKEIIELSIIAKKPIDVHLMVNNPITYIKKLITLNISAICFHVELKKNLKELISIVKCSGIKCGLAIDIDTEVDMLYPYLDIIDYVLVMSVKAGYGGQKFNTSSLDKINILKNEIKRRNLKINIELDGGINNTNIDLIKEHDIDIIVLGSYITDSDNYEEKINEIR